MIIFIHKKDSLRIQGDNKQKSPHLELSVKSHTNLFLHISIYIFISKTYIDRININGLLELRKNNILLLYSLNKYITTLTRHRR